MQLNSRTTPQYFPDPDQTSVLRLGLLPLQEKNWLSVDEDYVAFHNHKNAIAQSHFAKVYQVLPSSVAAVEEFGDFLLSHLLLYHSDKFSRTENKLKHSHSEIEFELPAKSLWESSLWVQEDICLMEEINGEYILSAASLCSPTHWNLEEKIGHNADKIHDPVPGYQSRLGNRVNRLLAGIKTSKPLMRYNWSIQNNTELCWRDDHPVEGGELNWRVERQTLLRLPETGAVVFGIRIFIHSFETMNKHCDFNKVLVPLLQRLPDSTRRYKNLNKYLNLLS